MTASPLSTAIYSLSRHLAMIAGGSDWKRTELAMFSAYFDASGDIHSAEALAVAGFVASAQLWIEWEGEWIERLGRDGLTCFHRNELGALPEHKRLRLLEDLANLIVNLSPYRVGVVIINKDLKLLTTDQDRKSWHVNSYSYAGKAAMVEIIQWVASWSGRMPEFVFENGDTGRGKLIDMCREHKYPDPIFKPKRDTIDPKTGLLVKGAVPLQAADLYAYDLFDRARDLARGKPVSRDFANGINPIIEKVLGRSGVATPHHIKFMAEGMAQRDSLIMETTVKIDAQTYRG